MRRLSGAVFRFLLDSLQEWVSIVLLFLTLGIAVWSIEQAKWIESQPSLILVLGLAVLACLFLVKSRIPDRATHFLMVVLGLAVTVWQSAVPFASTEEQGALRFWWQAVSSGQLNEGTVHFAMFLIFVTWLIGFVSTWFILRRRNAWVAVFLGTVTILVNLSNLPHNYYNFFPFYLLMAMLLIGQGNLARRADSLSKQEGSYRYRGIIYFIVAVVCISVLTVSTAWFVPEPPIDQTGLRMNLRTRGTNAEEHWFNIFATVPSKWSLIESSEQETLSFQDPIASGTRIQFVITSDRSGYWRTRRYDTYHSWGWTNSQLDEQALNPEVIANDSAALPGSNILTYTVENRLNTDVLLTQGEFISADIPVLLKTLTADESVAKSPDFSTSQPTTTEADRIGSEEQDIITVVSPRLLGPYQRYTVVATVTSVTPDELSQADKEYEPWVTDYYLQLPDSLPEQVRLLSREITEGMETPYDKVMAIKEFLNKFKYNLEGKVAPEEVDGVDYFLFEAEEGVCNSFASAMVVMLRSVGVPARLCTGYLRGELDEDTENFIIRSQNYHAWAEVHFPGYGWIEFEATPTTESENEYEIVSAGDTFSDSDELQRWMREPELTPPEDVGISGTARTRRSGLKFWAYFAIVSIPLVLVFTVRLLFGRWLERLKRVQTAFEAYARMCFLTSWGKSGPTAQETPLEYCARLARALPAQAEAISTIAEAYMGTQYSPRKELGELQKARLQKSWVVLCPFLLRHLLRLRRGAA